MGKVAEEVEQYKREMLVGQKSRRPIRICQSSPGTSLVVCTYSTHDAAIFPA